MSTNKITIPPQLRGGIFLLSLLAVAAGCGPSNVDEMGTAVNRPKAAWIRVVNLTDGPLSATARKTKLLTDDAPKSWRPFVPISPGEVSVEITQDGTTSKQPVSAKSEGTISIFVSGSKPLQYATFVSEVRVNDQDGASVQPVLLEDSKASTLPPSAVTVKDGSKLSANDDLNQALMVPAGKHTLTVSAGGSTTTVDGDFEKKVAYTLLVHKTGGKLEAYVLRNSPSTIGPAAQGTSQGG